MGDKYKLSSHLNSAHFAILIVPLIINFNDSYSDFDIDIDCSQ